MTRLHQPASRGNALARPLEALPLFAWAARRPAMPSPMPHAARLLAHRFHLSPALARVVAERAGFFME